VTYIPESILASNDIFLQTTEAPLTTTVASINADGTWGNLKKISPPTIEEIDDEAEQQQAQSQENNRQTKAGKCDSTNYFEHFDSMEDMDDNGNISDSNNVNKPMALDAADTSSLKRGGHHISEILKMEKSHEFLQYSKA
jgi:rRNA maturation endonuclease Nob1